VQALADALEGVDVPVFIKNPLHPDLSLWIGALERFRSAGHERIGAIHRGFYLADNKNYRNYPHWDLAVQLKAKYPDIPLISDISHMAGKPSLLPQLAQKAMNLDMDGLLIESHYDPSIALSDAEQQIKPDQLKSLIDGITFKSVSSEDQEFRNKLDLLRAQIDKIDEELVDKLAVRMGIAEEIGIYKKQNQVTILQLERWQQIMKQVKAQAELLGLSDGFMEKLYNAIHEESIRIQIDSKED
jgi:chorismate mutase